jgi:hypothetical protein
MADNNVDPVTGNMTLVTVAPGKRLTVHSGNFTRTYNGALAGAALNTGDTIAVPNFEVQYLKRDGVIL